jgi:multidrug efflux system outer membrane protein
MIVIRRSVAGLIAIPLAGCAVGPNYEEPDPSFAIPDRWEQAVIDEMEGDESALETWWTRLNDTTLTSLIRRAELANLDLRAAVARVREARALRGVAKGGFFPDINLYGAYSRTQLSDNGFQLLPGGDPGGAVIETDPFNNWTLGLDFSWEIDVFGRIRRTVEAADATLQASIEDYRDVLVTLYAEVASAYVDLRTFQKRISFAEANAQAQRSSLQLTRDRYRAGLTSALDVRQAESNLAQTEARIPLLEVGRQTSLNRLAVLLGVAPGALDDELGTPAPIPVPDEAVLVGIPVDLLRRRPDIRAAERSLAAQTALVGVATAELYPSFSLFGLIEFNSTETDNLFEDGSLGWNIMPSFRWPLFTGGKLRNRVRVEQARTDQALVAYELSILLALEEVNNSIIAYGRERERRDRLNEAAVASQQAVSLVETQYTSGLTNFQNFLDTQRSLFNQQDELASSQGQVVLNLIALNKALGGGWDPDLDPLTVTAADSQETTPANE